MGILKDAVLPLCPPFPGDGSVVAMDGAPVHLKPLVRAECARVGVLCLFLPSYGYSLNPTELVINAARSRMKRKYGMGHNMLRMNGRRPGDIFVECCYDTVTPKMACDFFAFCGIPVSPQDRFAAENKV